MKNDLVIEGTLKKNYDPIIKDSKPFKAKDGSYHATMEEVDKANEKYFINVCSAGLFTNSSQRADPNLKKTLGKVSYFITGAKELFSVPFTCDAGDLSIDVFISE